MNCKLNLYQNEKIDTTKQPLFFGCARNTQRYDKNRYEKLATLSDRMQELFWRPEEVSLKKDAIDFQILTDAERHIFTTQLSKLVMLDSLQGRSSLLMFGQLTTNPEFEASLLEQTYFEARIHSRSYSYLIERVYPNPSEIFDASWDIEELRDETDTITREYNDLYDSVIEYLYRRNIKNEEYSQEEMDKLKEKIFLSLVSMNILEGIRFYLGFASIWAITEFSNKMAGSSRILQFIARDENKHLEFTQYLINTLKKDPEWKHIWQKIIPRVYDMYFEASEEEFRWADELYKKGSILGMNADIGKMFIKHLTNTRLRAIGLKPIYPEIKKNPLKWINKYLNFSMSEKALQESEEIDYIVNPVDFEDEFDPKELYKLL